MKKTPATIVAAIDAHRRRVPNQIAISWQKGNDTWEEVSYERLCQQACEIAHKLSARTSQGDCVLIACTSGTAFAKYVLGCFLAGVVAVPASLPRRRREQTVQAIVRDCKPSMVLTDVFDSHRDVLKNAVGETPVVNLNWDLGQLQTERGRAELVSAVEPAEVAVLQYTSGSTAFPKGVSITHANIVANLESIAMAFGLDHESKVVSWLPIFHDMGLFGGILAPLYTGFPTSLVAPEYFLARPQRWLRLVSDLRATCTGGPNFAFELCVDRISDSDKSSLDLSSLRVAFCGAEPVRPDTVRRFSSAFRDCQFSESAFFPCYGLAESTLFAAGGPIEKPPRILTLNRAALEAGEVLESSGGDAVELVGCGSTLIEPRVRICGEGSFESLPADRVGEICIAGESVSPGYWNGTRRCVVQRDDYWFRTGDLGFVRNNELFVTGRIKDLMIVRGRNIYPQDIESLYANEVPNCVPNRIAAFAQGESMSSTSIVLVAECDRKALRWIQHRDRFARESQVLFDAIQEFRCVALDNYAVEIDRVVILRPASFPMTSSGKPQRQLAKKLLLADELQVIWEERFLETEVSKGTLPPMDVVTVMGEWGASRGRQFSCDLDLSTSLRSLRLDSLEEAEVASLLQEHFGVVVAVQCLHRHPDLQSLNSYLQKRANAANK